VNDLRFEWSLSKAESNRCKHHVAFEEATVFGDPFSRTIPDPDHSDDEERYVTVGRSAAQRILVIVHTEGSNRIRLITARLAIKAERKQYEERPETAS
jgi:uncharacterized DUF497 family protein